MSFSSAGKAEVVDGVLIIQEGTDEIGWDEYRDRTDFTGVSFPKSLKSIEGFAFCGCTGLKELTFPENVKCIGERAFGDCSGLETLTVLGGNVLFNADDDEDDYEKGWEYSHAVKGVGRKPERYICSGSAQGLKNSSKEKKR